MAAIISIVLTLTAILAIVTVLAHCAAIFWPRKALTAPMDTEGRPIVFRNETEKKKNVACVWWEDPAEELAAEIASKQRQPSPKNTSFCTTVHPLDVSNPTERHSIA